MKKKDKQLGEPHGTACYRLRKSIMFQLVQQAGRDSCFQCGKRIKTVDQFSIDHKVPWTDSADPVKTFFNLNNIAFSHFRCNVGAARQTRKAPVIRSDGWWYPSIAEAAEDSGVTAWSIRRVLRGARKTCGGFGWECA